MATENNKQARSVYAGEWRSKNAEILKQKKKQWYRENIEAIRLQKKQNYLKNADREKERAKKWRIDNSERYKAFLKEWRANNQQKSRELIRKWRKENPEKKRLLEQKRRAGSGSVSSEEINILWDRQRGLCAYFSVCGNKLIASGTGGAHRDHIEPLVPRDRGRDRGDNSISNIQLLCATCNARKGNRDPYKFTQEYEGRLFPDLPSSKKRETLPLTGATDGR